MDFLSFYWRDVLDIAPRNAAFIPHPASYPGNARVFGAHRSGRSGGGVRPLAFYRPLFLVMAAGEPVRFAVPCHRDPVS